VPNNQLHHKEGGSWTQKSFKGQAITTLKEIWNSFVHDNGELLVLDTRDIIEELQYCL